MHRDQIRQNMQRILETTQCHWDELRKATAPPHDLGDTGSTTVLNTKVRGTDKAQGLESQDGRTTSWQRTS